MFQTSTTMGTLTPTTSSAWRCGRACWKAKATAAPPACRNTSTSCSVCGRRSRSWPTSTRFRTMSVTHTYYTHRLAYAFVSPAWVGFGGLWWTSSLGYVLSWCYSVGYGSRDRQTCYILTGYYHASILRSNISVKLLGRWVGKLPKFKTTKQNKSDMYRVNCSIKPTFV